MQSTGCSQATFDNTYGVNSEDILDFGAIVSDDGTQAETVTGTPLSGGDVVYLASWFVFGYVSCHPIHYLQLDVGTNNSNTLDYNKGAKFAQTVEGVSSYAAAQGPHVTVYGANDIETFYNPSKGTIRTPPIATIGETATSLAAALIM